MEPALFRKVDCVSLQVGDLEQALAFYSERLGHTLKWRTPDEAGLRMPETDAELVIHTQAGRPSATAELLVSAVPEAVKRFEAEGGGVAFGPFEIRIGRCAVVTDPWGNHLVLLDMSKGALRTDERGNVIP